MIDKKLLVTAHELANISGAIARSYFRKKNIRSSLKTSKYPVTDADLFIEKELRKHLKITFPAHSILGEEYGITQKKSDYLWVLDPIDGTTSFVCGKPTFCTLIGLLYKNKPILGLIDQPITNERWFCENGQISQLNNEKCLVNTQESGLLRLNCTTPFMFTNNQLEIFQSVHELVDSCCFGGDGYAYGLMASGHIDIIMEADLKFYDVAALIPIIEGIGGTITDWSGNKIDINTFDGTVLATRSNKIHKKIIKIIS